MSDDLLVLHRAGDADPDGSKLRGVLSAHLAFERARSLREMIVYGLLAVSLPVWIAAARPEWLSAQLKTLALTAWLVTAIGLALAFVSERRWHHRCVALADQRRPRASS
jgi:hypothetical protein